MDNNNILESKKELNQNARRFLDTMFGKALYDSLGEIEIQGIKNGQIFESYHSSVSSALETAYDLCNHNIDAYVGVNPRTGGAGKKENVKSLVAFHAEIDYGQVGHKKTSEYNNCDEALAAINDYEMTPTWVNHSGGGFHCYWILNEPIQVASIGIDKIENVNKALTAGLKGDAGTHNINRILRVPGTYNFKLPNNPREITVVIDDGPKYDIDDFSDMFEFQNTHQKINGNEGNKPDDNDNIDFSFASGFETDDNLKNRISSLKTSDKIKNLIFNGNDGSYPSRSEADQAVITVLVNKGMMFNEIKKIFSHFKIGEKYREHSSPDAYLKGNIKKAESFSHLTEDERIDPLFISDALNKDDKNKYYLNIVNFQEYITKKHKLKFLENERAFFVYNEKCYEQCSEDKLNNICQTELGKFRNLFSPSSRGNFIHYAIGDEMVSGKKAYSDQENYLTMQNGLYDLSANQLIDHTTDIFTTNLLPYDYNPASECQRWIKYLNQIFLNDMETINFVQEAVGYAFQKSIPTAAIFFLIGDGGNGKSVFIDVISNLCGAENVCNISLNKLSDEKYLLELFGKMINVSGETPSSKCIDTALIKSVVSGDWVTGREVYQKPKKFKPFAKHYLGMNSLPQIEDNTHGMWRRIYVIDFPRKFTESEMDVELTDKLLNELSGIFNWALEGYKRLRKRNFKFKESTNINHAKSRYKRQNSPVLGFIEHYIDTADENYSVSLKDAYDKYKSYCVKDKVKNTNSKIEFRRNLESEGYIVENSKRHANQVRIIGVSLKEVND